MIKPWIKRVRSLSALDSHDFRLYLLGQTISVAGSWTQITALSWLVYELTDSSLALGGVNFVTLIPAVPFSLIGGSIADRFSKRNLLILTTIAAICQAGVLAFLAWTGQIQIWHIFLLSLILGAINAVETGTRQAIIIELVGTDKVTSGVALTSTIWSIARIIGPALAAGLLVTVGAVGCFTFNALSFLTALITLVAIRPKIAVPRRSDPFSVTGDFREVVSYFFKNKDATAILMLVTLSATFVFSFNTLLPAFAVDVLNIGPQGFGILTAVFGVGTIIGAMGFASIDNSFGRGSLFALGRILAPLFLLFFAISQSYILSCVLIAVSGIFLVTQNSLGDPLLQTLTPPHLRGRVLSVFALSTLGMLRLGGVILGAVADQVGAPLTLSGSVLIGLMGCLLVLYKIPSVTKLT